MPVPTLVPQACPYTLTISGESMHRGAFNCGNLDELVQRVFRHDDVLVPNVAGRSPRAPVLDAYEASLPFVFSGAVDRAGAANADPVAGLAVTRRWFEANIVTPPAGSAGTRPGVLTDGDGTVLTADLHVVGWRWQQHGVPRGLARAVLRVEVVAGRWI